MTTWAVCGYQRRSKLVISETVAMLDKVESKILEVLETLNEDLER